MRYLFNNQNIHLTQKTITQLHSVTSAFSGHIHGNNGKGKSQTSKTSLKADQPYKHC